MGKAGFYILRFAPLSSDVETGVGVLRENPTANHPVLACRPTGRPLRLVFIHHHAGGEGPFTFIHVLPRSLPLYDMRVSIDYRHGPTPSFFKFTTTLLGRAPRCCQ